MLLLLQADVSSFLISVPVTFFFAFLFIFCSNVSLRTSNLLRYLQQDPCEFPNCEIVKQMTYLSHALSATLSFYSHFLPKAGGMLMSVNSTPTLSQTCNYCRVYLYLKHCLTRKICQYAANAFIWALKLNKLLGAML